MKVINFGSLNIDHVYYVDTFVKPGETIASGEYKQFCGGKGCNQSVALAQAGGSVMHAGKIGPEGDWLKQRLTDSGADVSMVIKGEAATGHAIIQVANSGENSIIIHGGANQTLDPNYVESVLEKADTADYVLTQNETSCVPEILSQAAGKGLFVVFNPAPMTPDVKSYPLNDVDLLILNESEGEALTGKAEPDDILKTLLSDYPNVRVVLTLGAAGAIYQSAEECFKVSAYSVEAIDTTAAGDTFIGYFLKELGTDAPIAKALQTACKAAALCVQKAGASDSIPHFNQVADWES